MESSEPVFHTIQEPLVRIEIADIRLCIENLCTKLAKLGHGFRDFALLNQVADSEVKPIARQTLRDSEADSPSSPGD
jgi:hypothetical protein